MNNGPPNFEDGDIFPIKKHGDIPSSILDGCLSYPQVGAQVFWDSHFPESKIYIPPKIHVTGISIYMNGGFLW